MRTGDIILIPFPFSELTHIKVRPAVVASITKDKYKDIILCAISSSLPERLSGNEIALIPDQVNNLRAASVLKIDRIVTLKRKDKISDLGKLSDKELMQFKKIFKNLVDDNS